MEERVKLVMISTEREPLQRQESAATHTHAGCNSYSSETLSLSLVPQGSNCACPAGKAWENSSSSYDILYGLISVVNRD